VLTGAVVVVWQDRPETEAALVSLATMSQPPDIVVCVLQECSGSFRRRLERLCVPGLSILERPDNLGFAAAANLGVEQALSSGAEWVLLLNNDATADPGCLAQCLAEATSDPTIAVAGPAVRIMDRPEQLWFAGGVHSELFAFTRHRGLGGPASEPPESSDTGYVSGCCALVSGAAWRTLGPFEEDFFVYYEDVEWCHRARAAGWRCRYVGATVCSHALGVSSGQRGSLGLSDTTAYYLARNPLHFALSTPSRWLRATRVVGILTIWGLYNAWRLRAAGSWGTVGSYLEGTRDAFAGRMGRRRSRGDSTP
jgi:GT2 family glycosyltransferase